MAELTDKSVRLDHPEVFNGVRVSYGIAPILNSLSVMSTRSNRPTWDLFLINIETLIRDRKSETGNYKEIAKAVLTDCTVLAQYMAAYCRFTLPTSSKQKAMVCFYLPKYETIPTQYLREKLPKGTEDRWRVRDEIARLVSTEGFQDHFDATEIIFIAQSTDKLWPHKSLLKDLNAFKSGIQYRKVLMVSHVPLDFHLAKVFSVFHVLESYTGVIKQVRDFGNKVFKDPDIPFNKYTHLLLGDKWYLKNQLSTKDKRKVKEESQKGKWTLIPTKAVLEKLAQLRLVPIDILTKPDI